jgi:hypothetical protein
MRTNSTLIAAMTLALLAGCSGGGSGTSAGPSAAPNSGAVTAGQPSKVDKAASVARAIQASPDRADQILRDNGMTEQQFSDLMYEIAADPAMSAEYSAKVRP